MLLHPEFLGYLAGIIALSGFIPYILGILKKQVIPNRVTWTLWTFISTILLISYISVSGGINASVWVPVGYVIGPAVIMFLSFPWGEGGYSQLDISSFFLSLVSIALWIITHMPLLALGANIIADASAAIPTIYKAYQRPHTESTLAWSLFLIGNTLNLFVVPQLTLAAIIYPGYLFFISLIIYLLTLRKYFGKPFLKNNK